MRRGIRKALRQSNPWSLERARRDRTVTIVGQAQTQNVYCLDVRNGAEMMVSELDAYIATMNSWCRLDQNSAQCDVMKEMLCAGVTLANSKGIFFIPEAKGQRQAKAQTETAHVSHLSRETPSVPSTKTDQSQMEQVIQEAVEKAVGNLRWQRAIARAKVELESNPYIHFDGQALLILSPSNEIYEANGMCQCKAYTSGQPCWHRAAARIVERYNETSH